MDLATEASCKETMEKMLPILLAHASFLLFILHLVPSPKMNTGFSKNCYVLRNGLYWHVLFHILNDSS